MTINTNTWNKIRYTIYQPFYDVAGGAFSEYREKSIDGLALMPEEKILILGAGTGLDLEYLTKQEQITAIDITPSMIADLMQRAEELGVPVKAKVMDGQALKFPDRKFDVVILHLILAVIPDPEECLREVRRVLKPKGRIAIMDKFVPADGRVSVMRKILNPITNFLFSDITRNINSLLEETGFIINGDEELRAGFRIVQASKNPKFRASKKKKELQKAEENNSLEWELDGDNPFYIGDRNKVKSSPVVEKETIAEEKNYDLNFDVFERFPVIKTKRTILRRFLATDASSYYQLRSNLDAMAFMDTAPCTSPTKAMSKIKSMNSDFDKQKAIWWAITEKQEGQVIGYFGIYNIDKKNKLAEIGYLLHPDFWQKGIMSEVMDQTIDFAFDNLNCHRLSANVNPHNEGSIALLDKFHFKKEAHFKEDYFYNGEFLDSVIFGLVRG